MNEFAIFLPEHAVRYLAKMCHEERGRLADFDEEAWGLAVVAAFDSLGAIEAALPALAATGEEKNG